MAKEIEKIFQFCKKSGIASAIERCRAIVVGFSGGADSAFLLTKMKEIAPEKYVVAAHLNHNIRGDEAKRDEDFCKAFCLERNIPFKAGSAKVLAIAENSGKSVEEAGREARYNFFDKCIKMIAAELSCDEKDVLVATAHNADDNLETVVFNLARGSSLRGLRGIMPERDGKYIRPILCLTSREIRLAVKKEGIPFVEDSTNADDAYTRNKIRHRIIPELEAINPEVRKTVLSMCASLASDDEYLNASSLAALGDERPVSADALRRLPRAVASRAVISLYAEESDGDLSSLHVDAVLGALEEKKHVKLHLPDHVTCYIGEHVEFVTELDKNEEISFEFPLLRGENAIEGTEWSIGFYDVDEYSKAENANIYKELIYKYFVNDKIKGDVFVRNRRPSDVYFIRGHHRRLKKLMCDAGIPQRFRDRLPVVCDSEGIVWVPGFPPRDDVVCGAAFVLTFSKTKEGEL